MGKFNFHMRSYSWFSTFTGNADSAPNPPSFCSGLLYCFPACESMHRHLPKRKRRSLCIDMFYQLPLLYMFSAESDVFVVSVHCLFIRLIMATSCMGCWKRMSNWTGKFCQNYLCTNHIVSRPWLISLAVHSLEIRMWWFLPKRKAFQLLCNWWFRSLILSLPFQSKLNR